MLHRKNEVQITVINLNNTIKNANNSVVQHSQSTPFPLVQCKMWLLE